MCLALISNEPGSLMYPVYITITQLPDTFNQILLRSTRSDIAENTTNIISEFSKAEAVNRSRDLWIDSPSALPLSYLRYNENMEFEDPYDILGS